MLENRSHEQSNSTPSFCGRGAVFFVGEAIVWIGEVLLACKLIIFFWHVKWLSGT